MHRIKSCRLCSYRLLTNKGLHFPGDFISTCYHKVNSILEGEIISRTTHKHHKNNCETGDSHGIVLIVEEGTGDHEVSGVVEG